MAWPCSCPVSDKCDVPGLDIVSKLVNFLSLTVVFQLAAIRDPDGAKRGMWSKLLKNVPDKTHDSRSKLKHHKPCDQQENH